MKETVQSSVIHSLVWIKLFVRKYLLFTVLLKGFQWRYLN